MPRNLFLALGDSVTAGHGATHPAMGFVRYVSDYARNHALTERTMVIAQNGWTTKDVLRSTQMISRAAWEQTNVLTLMTGGNDLRRLLRRQYLSLSPTPITPQLVGQTLQEFEMHMDMLCGTIRQWDIPHVLVATVYNPAPNFPLAVHAIEALNGIVRKTAGSYQFDVVDVYKGFQANEAYYIDGYRSGRYEDLATPFRRPIHPNNVGHRQISDLITKHLSTRTDGKGTSRRRAPRKFSV